ncbi:MAG: sulfotransferase domain-containing protein [Actinobacteria bacterium]|nr:sulfotransferase domain-containing protein [Actinomycetota bacterium]
MSPVSHRSVGARVAHQADRAWRGLRLAVARVDPRERALPDFVVIGAQKAGTSSLYGQLSAHPSVMPALRKEIHHFDRAPASPGRYRGWFPRRAALDRVARRTGRGITGEATPFYLCHPAVPGRMRAVLPDVRLIAVLRDPVARAISGYHHAVRVGDETRPIEVALDPSATEALPPATDVAWYDAPDCPLRLHGYLARGRYAEQLERWFSAYPRGQVLVIDSDALRGGRVPDAVLEFLDLPGSGPAEVPDRNVGAYAAPASELEAGLREYFRPHDARLASLLGVELSWTT